VSKRDAAAAKSRARIIKAATKLFAEHGFDATSTSAIAKEAGVPSGLIFYYFDNKERLLDEIFKAPLFAETLAQLFDDVAHQPPVVALKTVAVQMLRWLNTNEDRGRLFFKEMTSHRSVSSRLHDSRRRNIERVAAYLDAAIDRKEMPPANTRALAQIFISSLLLAAIFDREMNVNAYASSLSETIAGVRNPRQGSRKPRRTPRRRPA
jgi:AcrR family transcriptional regulator